MSQKMSVEQMREQLWQERVASAARRLGELTENPPEECPTCHHRPYPIVATQDCWCDPAEEVDES